MSYQRRPQPTAGWFSDTLQANEEFASMLWHAFPPVMIYDYVTKDRPLAQAVEQAKADKLRYQAEQQVAAEEAARAQLAAAGGAMIPPPLTDEQKNILVGAKEKGLRDKETSTKLILAGLMTVGGIYAWKKMKRRRR